MEQQHFDKIDMALKDILASNSKSIFDEENKKIFNGAIRKKCSDDVLARDVLLELVVNDVFVFIRKNENKLCVVNVYNSLSKFNFTSKDYEYIFNILGISSEARKINKKKAVKKLSIILSLCGIILGFFTYLFLDYNSYFRTPNDILVYGGSGVVDECYQEISPFFISKTEIYDENKMPIVNISWYDAVKYCNRLSEKYGLDCVYTFSEDGKKVEVDITKSGYRLPTKAELYWVAEKTEDTNPEHIAWCLLNSNEMLHEVATKKPNKLGLYDVFGNAAEWVWDSADEKHHYVCGGFFGSAAKYISLSNFCSSHPSEFGEVYIGFRVVRSFTRTKFKFLSNYKLKPYRLTENLKILTEKMSISERKKQIENGER